MSDKFIMLKNVRCSFPALFTKPIINGEEGKCGLTVLLDPKDPAHKASLKELQTEISRLIKADLKGTRLSADKLCLRDGNESTRAEYRGYWYVSANHKTKPVVISNDGQTVVTAEEDCAIYTGCRVNAKLQLWAQNNKFGKRVNATPIAVQFFADDEPFDSSYVSIDEAMQGFDGFDDKDVFDDMDANDDGDIDEMQFG